MAEHKVFLTKAQIKELVAAANNQIEVYDEAEFPGSLVAIRSLETAVTRLLAALHRDTSR